ncbi:type II toxin-antitoxin system antitoxin, RelB/DinJ family [Candidatus Peregrinibacteria bacterium CG11_big_fil_rev_8_21_14_0_20_41_10]|nr:MAG: type II toxin-antitoxin system antitoxin, RelB/DinJ family [Candidatus Peregrinibacteria bacterium CG11_big_fil_rev_8_21_14_0_20_41_10]PIZ74256.1 MAG: type II toxin-antitoxin system antitoxin, RelB/DinJ family [Candidatus Peregrinibacteria bacterium CG_4_10_14_0_2_um_filter_41_8]PJC38202.1 MAG: type II toxin-antitoxin system antitoxin, RelB/DinJ family [Candidatus Peregrinibacteria bacterium CG_4_9_14_0_2_um_filter_41_14]
MPKIQIRIDEKTKNSAKKVLDKLGLDMTSAITVYLKQIVTHNGIPFPLITENGLTPAQEKAILKASAEAEQGKNITEQMSAKEAVDYLKSL